MYGRIYVLLVEGGEIETSKNTKFFPGQGGCMFKGGIPRFDEGILWKFCYQYATRIYRLIVGLLMA